MPPNKFVAQMRCYNRYEEALKISGCTLFRMYEVRLILRNVEDTMKTQFFEF